MDKTIIYYQIKFQDSNVVIIKFFKDELLNILKLKSSFVWIELGKDKNSFWDCFEDALLEIEGVLFVMFEDCEMIVVKDPQLPNWGKIVEDVMWSSLFFLNPSGSAVEASKRDKKIIGKLITQQFNAIERPYKNI